MPEQQPERVGVGGGGAHQGGDGILAVVAGADRLGQPGAGAIEHCPVHVGLRVEVPVEDHARDPGLRGDVIQAGRGEPGAGERAGGGGQDLLTALGPPQAARRSGLSFALRSPGTAWLPFEQARPLQAPPRLRALQAQGPVHTIRTATGDQAWLVTGYEEVRRLLADPRLGRCHPDPASAARTGESVLFGGPLGRYETEDADHARMRSLLQPHMPAHQEGLRSHTAACTA